MADYVLAFGLVVAIAALLFGAWRAVRGPAPTRGWRALRLAVSVAVAVALTATGLYTLMNSRTVQLAGGFLRRVETPEKVVALTFDDGPTPAYAREVLEILRSRGIRATFFVTGREASEAPADLTAIVEAGHQVGNHSWSHRRLVFLPADTVAEEFDRTDALIRAAGYRGPILVRTPNGKRLLTTPLYLAASGRTNVFWDSEPDSDPGVDAAGIRRIVLSDVRPGSIVLMHVMYDSRAPSREALPLVIDALIARGYRFVTLDELQASARE
ncbi:MAG: polysaccharide deacetylase family protein [Coriobacteriia bacterium]|nr:polysaccharide deacetylase family protein [Coriobacteriia bacterium]